MDTLIAQVRSIHQRDAQSDRDIARRLGVSRATWNFARAGKRRLSLKILRGIVKGFPELATPAMMAVLAPGTESQESTQEAREVALVGITAAEGRE